METDNDFIRKLRQLTELIYPEIDHQIFVKKLIATMQLDENDEPPLAHSNHWNEKDIFMISYGDSLVEENQKPLSTLHDFCQNYLKDCINTVHILPFYPYSSDDGFSVIDYYMVNHSLGDWNDILKISHSMNIMTDLVINHCSSRSGWFENFKQRKEPGLDYFFEASPEDDLSQVVRPRATPLLKEIDTLDGKRYVWCTFSHDQIDLNFANPKVLLEFVSIIRFYLDHNIHIFRLDAVAFLWKEIGTSCINHEKTHQIIQLLRLLIETKNHHSIVITETNIPNRENLTYFGNANEAHAIYNFALPPLLLNTLITGSCQYLKNWLMTLPPAQNGTTYFNFIASHDGIGLRPIEGILDDQETEQLINTMMDFGGKISWRALDNGQNKAYEINISLFDALSGTINGADQWQVQRFLCAHTIMLAIEGIPAFYIHSLLATENDYQRVEMTSQNRSINRHKWIYNELKSVLNDKSSHHAQVFDQLQQLIQIRKNQPAFHPNATQYTLHISDQIFAFWRQSQNRQQSIFCIHNISNEPQELNLSQLNLIELNNWFDLLSKEEFPDLCQNIVLEPYQCLWITNHR